MPELPETETIARDLHSTVVEAVVARVTVHREDVLREITPERVIAAIETQLAPLAPPILSPD